MAKTKNANYQFEGTSALQPNTEANSGKITKKIGSTTYHVSIFFSRTSRETINDKIVRLIKNEALN